MTASQSVSTIIAVSGVWRVYEFFQNNKKGGKVGGRLLV